MATRLAICGLGQGMDHVNACLKHECIRIVALVDKCQERQNRGWERIRAKYPESPCKSYNGLRELVGDNDMKHRLDGVILALPHHAYREEWHYIMGLDVPILKEKPLGRHLFEANSFLLKAHSKDIVLITAVQRRYHAAYRTLRKLINQKQRIYSIRIIYNLGSNEQSKSEGWRRDLQKSGGGMLLDAGYHMIDLVQFLVGTGQLISATLTKGTTPHEIPCSQQDMEEHCYVTISKNSILISMECHQFGKKTELVFIDTEDGQIKLERGTDTFKLMEPSGEVHEFDSDWDDALGCQIKEFVENIGNPSLDNQRVAYSQLPVQRIIDDAYALAAQFSLGKVDRPKNGWRERE